MNRPFKRQSETEPAVDDCDVEDPLSVPGQFIGSNDLTLKSLRKIIQAERYIFRSQFKNRTEKGCFGGLIWSPDPDYKQLPPDSTDVWKHWTKMVDEYVMVVRSEKTTKSSEKSCFSKSHYDCHHFDFDTDVQFARKLKELGAEAIVVCEERTPDEYHNVTIKKKKVGEGSLDVGVLRYTLQESDKLHRGDIKESSVKETGELILRVDDCLMHYTTRMVAYCLCIAEMRFQMLSARESVRMCIKALQICVARQQNCFTSPTIPKQEVGELLEYVWKRIRKYNRDSRMIGSGKDAFLNKLQVDFSKGKFVRETRDWLQGEYDKQENLLKQPNSARALHMSATGLGMSVTGKSLNMSANQLSATRGPTESQLWRTCSNERSALDVAANRRLKGVENKLAEALAAAEMGDIEAQHVTFARYLKNSREQERKYQGTGYAMSIYALYAICAFLFVYVYETSYCFVDSKSIGIEYWDGFETVNMTFYQWDLYAIKTDKTSTIFGGVYGPDTNAGMYLFNGEDSNEYYKKQFGVPVPRPRCATSSSVIFSSVPEFVCYKPRCKSYTQDYLPVEVGVEEAADGAVCRCRPINHHSGSHSNNTNETGMDALTMTRRNTMYNYLQDHHVIHRRNSLRGTKNSTNVTNKTSNMPPGLDHVNSGVAVWDDSGLQGFILRVVRNYWSAMYFGVAILEMILFSLALLFIDWPMPPRTSFESEEFMQSRTDEIRKHRVCLLIAHYGNFGALAESLEPALAIFPPEHIFVCHNSNHLHPFDKGKAGQTLKKIRELERCKSLTKHINYSYSCEGNKTLAIYATALHKCKHMKYCMMIDNDVILPEDLHIPMDIFGDKNQSHVKALAFTIKASNPFNRAGSTNWVSAMQNIEYIKAGWTKMLQSQMGSALYAHGAISLWEKEIMISVFKQHNTFFDGEDLQMGVILHGFNQGYSIKTVANVSVETEVPAHSICWKWNTERAKKQYPIPFVHTLLRFFFVAPLKCGAWGCGYNEKSLFRQRVASWDKGAHRAFMWYMQLLFMNWSMSTIALKPYLFYEVWSIINDWSWPWLMVLFFWSSTSNDRSEFAEWMLMITIVDLLLMSFMNQFKFAERRDMRSRIIDCISFAIYKYVLKLLRLVALLYNLIHYFPRAETPLVIQDRVVLPPFIDDSCIFLEEEAADMNGLRQIRQNEDTNELKIINSLGSLAVKKGSVLERTAHLLIETSDSVSVEDGWKIHRPKHFVLSGDSWRIRRWGQDQWELLDEKQDKAGGAGLDHDLERLCRALDWALELLAEPEQLHTSAGSSLRPQPASLLEQARAELASPGSAAPEATAPVRWECAVTLGGCVEGCLRNVGTLVELQKQGTRPSGKEDAENVMAALQDCATLLRILVHGEENTFAIEEQEDKTHKNCKYLRGISASLHVTKVDPEGDVQAVLFTLGAFAIGGLFGYQWDNLAGDKGKAHITGWGLPTWVADWGWFLAVFLACCLIFICSIGVPLLISKMEAGKGKTVPLLNERKRSLTDDKKEI